MAYAARYPERVDRFVLDAAIPHGMVSGLLSSHWPCTERDTQPYQDMVTSQVAAANRLVQRSDAFCLTDPTCPFYGQGNGSVVKVCTYIFPEEHL
jgi:pimeloyl-ACP methyl ester carboxylesterase